MEEAQQESHGWSFWLDALKAQSRGKEVQSECTLEDEIAVPVYQAYRQVDSARPASATPWKIRGAVRSKEEVMPALQGGVEVLRMLGCNDPTGWLEGVEKSFVEIEFLGGADSRSLMESGAKPDRGGVLMDYLDAGQGALEKFNPLANWRSADVWDYIRDRQVPYNPLHEQGYVSIGCEPCTRAVAPHEHERAGRWWWESATHKECGLHRQNLIAHG